MENERELFDNFCFLPAWNEVAETPPQYISRHKDLDTLLQELEEIKNRMEEIKARKWHLAELLKFHEHDFI